MPLAPGALALSAVVPPYAAAAAPPRESLTGIRDATPGSNDPIAALAAGYELLRSQYRSAGAKQCARERAQRARTVRAR
jgi:hypothetical protein